MAEAQKYDWSAPPLSAEDEALRDAYQRVGVAVDSLPYTEYMDDLLDQLQWERTDANRRLAYHRLMRLRKMARLPRVPRSMV